MTQSPLQILQQYWKFDNFRPGQLEIIQSVLDGEDTFALLPTGGGKSVCFQVPAMVKEGICIVISPLIALMQDQIKGIKEKGIKGIALPSGITYKELDTLLDNCIYGGYKFLYLSPERLQQEIVQERIKQMNVNLIAIDEAHCISEWGNDFRPSYRKINILRELHPTIPMIALTASATKPVVDDIVQELDLFQPKIFKSSFYRKNLAYHIIDAPDKRHKIVTLLAQHKGSAIIYVRNRKTTLALYDFLTQHNYIATYYHGGIPAEEKSKRFEQWYTEEVRIMIATTAFGMGIDKANVRMVIHYAIPESVESYFQEAGRAGRDGILSYAYLLKNESDTHRLTNQFIKVLPDANAVKVIYKKLCNYFQIPYGEGQQSSYYFDFNTFCKTYSFHHLITYNALQFLDRCGVVRFNKRFTKETSIQMLTSSGSLLQYLKGKPEQQLIIKAILRTYSGIFDELTDINLTLIATKINSDEATMIPILQSIADEGMITFEHITADAEVIFLLPREDDRTINRIQHHLQAQNQAKKDKVDAMLRFTNDTTGCKSAELLRYFGEKHPKACGICSYCTTQDIKPVDSEQVKNEIIKVLQDKEVSSRTMMSLINYQESIILEVLQQMLSFGIITINHNNNYQLI